MTVRAKAEDAAVQQAASSGHLAEAVPSTLEQLEQYRGNVATALPPGFTGGVDRFMRIVRSAVSSNPDLAVCTSRSVAAAAILAAQLGLTPNLMGQCWILPYENKKMRRYEAQFQVGYKGLIELAGRAGIEIRAATVKASDFYCEEQGLAPKLEHRKPLEGERGPSVRWYAIAEHTEWARPRFESLDRAEVERFRKASKSPNGPGWTGWYDEMAMSKAIRVCCRYIRMSVELRQFARALTYDDGAVVDLDSIVNLPPEEADDAVIEAYIATTEEDTTP